jgi:hypothetical protein
MSRNAERNKPTNLCLAEIRHDAPAWRWSDYKAAL